MQQLAKGLCDVACLHQVPFIYEVPGNMPAPQWTAVSGALRRCQFGCIVRRPSQLFGVGASLDGLQRTCHRERSRHGRHSRISSVRARIPQRLVAEFARALVQTDMHKMASAMGRVCV